MHKLPAQQCHRGLGVLWRGAVDPEGHYLGVFVLVILVHGVQHRDAGLEGFPAIKRGPVPAGERHPAGQGAAGGGVLSGDKAQDGAELHEAGDGLEGQEIGAGLCVLGWGRVCVLFE